MADVAEIPCKEREAKARELLAILGTTPMFVFDMMLYAATDEFHFSPILAEQYMEHCGHHIGEDECLMDAMTRIYGKRAAELAEALI